MVDIARGTALVRPPGPRLAGGIVTHIARTPVDVALAREQHASYVGALAGAGWDLITVPPADDCPDAVFIEDTVIVVDDLAVITRPGAPVRRPEIAAVAEAVRALGLRLESIVEPGTLDGGDVLQIGQTVYVGLGGRTNTEGIAQLADLLAIVGRTTVTVPLAEVLHLKSAVTALPDGTVLACGDLVDVDAFPKVQRVPEEAGAHVVLLGGTDVLIAASAPRTAELLTTLGWNPIVVDITEYERLEGCVT
jgi:dimethylargininase